MRLPSVALLAALGTFVPPRSHAQTASMSRQPLAALSPTNKEVKVAMALLAALTTWLGVHAGRR
jgi:hypothetical protein